MGKAIDPYRFYTRLEVTELLSVSAKTVCSAVRSGKLLVSRVGATDLYKGEWLISWLESAAKHEVPAS